MSVEAVISLSSIPPRFGQLRPTLESLVRQNHAADAILLWVPHRYRRFPDWDGALPSVPEGVTIRRCEEDFGPATKVLPAIFQYAGTAVKIVFCDDDRIYGPDWLAMILGISAERPGECVAGWGGDIPGDMGRPPRTADRLPRLNTSTSVYAVQAVIEMQRMIKARPPTVRSSGYADILKGYGGVMVQPDFLASSDLSVIPPVLWTVDDVWLSGHLEINRIPIWTDTRIPFSEPSPEADDAHALVHSEIEGHRREAADRAAIDHFRKTHGIWMPSQSERMLSAVRPGVSRAAKSALGSVRTLLKR